MNINQMVDIFGLFYSTVFHSSSLRGNLTVIPKKYINNYLTT